MHNFRLIKSTRGGRVISFDIFIFGQQITKASFNKKFTLFCLLQKCTPNYVKIIICSKYKKSETSQILTITLKMWQKKAIITKTTG